MTQLVAGAVNAFGAVLGGQSKQQMYNRKAADTRLRGRIDAMNLQFKAAQLLDKVDSIMSTSLARSMVGGGSTNIMAVQTGSLKHGVRDYGIIKDNIDIQMGRAEAQAQDYIYAGEIAVRDSYIEAMASVVGGHARQSQLGYPDFGTQTPTTGGSTGVTYTGSSGATYSSTPGYSGSYTAYEPGG